MYQCVEAWAAEDPAALAICGPDRLTTAELVARADAIARCLWQLGLRPGDRAGLLLGRSSDAVAAILAAARIGAAYVPIDPALPASVRNQILADAEARVVVTMADGLTTLPTLRLDQALPGRTPLPHLPAIDPGAPAYVMYTSGSTGAPKGVVVPWRGVLRLVQNPSYVTFAPTDIILHAAPLGFDASTLEIWGALLNRAALAIVPDALPSLDTIAEALERYGVTIAWLTSGLFHAMVDARLPALRRVRQLLAGGDVLSPPHVARALAALPDTTLINGYGPTENTTFTCCYPIPRDHAADTAVPIGWPIRGTTVWLLDEQGRPVADGEEGELCAGGQGVALGYLNRPDATTAVFVTGPDGQPMYRTGDRARRRPDGAILFAGRKDREVKIRGKRVCLDDVEAAILQDPAVREAAVVFKAGRADAFVTGNVEAAGLRRALLARLPEHMVPSVITVLGAMPLTRTGKLDRKALPAASGNAERLETVWLSVLGRELAADANLFDAGVSSLDVVRAHAAMTDAGLPVSLTDLFAFPSVASLAAHLDGTTLTPVETGRGAGGDIAIIGMAARLPGADDLDTFWSNLYDGVESITRFAPADLQDASNPQTRADPAFVAARPVLDGIDQFDPAFFAMTRREAELTDPQHRVFLEIAWEALEMAGQDPAACKGRIGVFAGSSPNSYLLRNVLPDRSAVLRYTSDYQTGSYATLLGAGSDFLATRVAYKLDLRGPAVTVATACSTSLVAVAQACAALRAGEADMALAGGVSITLPQRRGYLHEPGGLASADGHVRPFDAAATGTVFGSGAAVVLLKRLADALADGDHVHAVIRGATTNNDGASKVGFTAPSVSGQAACIATAQAQAGVAPDSIGYVEAHGTATPLGDPIEVAALRQAWGAGAQPGRCVLGSVKGNIGHLDAASGCAGLIKAVLAIEREMIPGTLHYQTPNAAMDLQNSPFRVSGQTEAWTAAAPRRAAVSSFGVGGTNAHAILEQAPVTPVSLEPGTPQVLLLSARSRAGLANATARLATHLERHPEQSLADVAWTLQTTRRRFKHRAALVCSNRADAIAGLRANQALIAEPPEGTGGVAFLFPGQGAQYPGMGRALYDGEPVFRSALDRCANILQPQLSLDLREVLFPAEGDEAAAGTLVNTAVAQPALFAISYAMAQLWLARGIRPAAMLGHSVGEFVAACLAGVFTVEDALSLIAARGRLMAGMPSGAMLSVRLPEAELLPLLGDTLDLAAANGPSLCVAAGPSTEIDQLEHVLKGRDVPCRRLHTSHAFHSRAMDGVAQALTEIVSTVALSAPAIPVISGVSGGWLTEAQATSPAYWAAHCRAPVRFEAGLATLRQAATPFAAVLECGPGRGLTQIALAGGWRNSSTAAIHSLPEAISDKTTQQTAAEAVARLWLAGIEADWVSLHAAHPGRRRVPLPPTPWDKTRCWIDEPAPVQIPELQQTMVQTTADLVNTDATALPELIGLFEELSGERLSGVDPATSFIQLGFDSLFLGQVAQQIRSRLGVKITFRQLLGDCGSFTALAQHIGSERPKPVAPATPVASAAPSPVAAAAPAAAATGAAALMQHQVQAMSALFAQQLAVLGSAPAAAPQHVTASIVSSPPENTARFDAFKVVAASSGNLTATGLAHVEDLVASTVARTGESKRLTADARSVLADPRAAAGFRPEWKEMTYPIVAVRSAGPHIWDADGNKYVDLVNGFGQTAFGHAPPFVVEAVKRQLDRGFEIGPQADLAGEVAARFCAMTGNERMTFCNTGSEAVMAAMRIARTVTGRTRIVTFSGSYHGQFDEVLVKAGPKGTRPVAPGIPLESVANISVLEYGQEESLAWIRQHAHELAAVIVEPVQSRHPALQPRAFLADLREITQRSGTCFVFDEVVTGFRTHPGGMQAILNIRADLATYGKVVGGGLPIGVLAGKAAFMDALDGGAWQYGDDSMPEAAVTFFAGTFVRHPLALAAMSAILTHVTEAGPAMYSNLESLTMGLAKRLNAALAAHGLPECVEYYASWFYFKLSDPLASLIYPHMRLRGVHIQEGFPCFLTTTHGQAEVDAIATAFEQSLAALQGAGILSLAPVSLVDTGATEVIEAPLTEAQMEIWLAAQLGDAASCAFNEGLSLDLQGVLDLAALTGALNRVFSRHDALRARFAADGTKMIIGEWQSVVLIVEDTELERVLDQEAHTPFNLVDGPPLRLRLIRVSENRHVLVLTVHHIVCDGWSINALLAELGGTRNLPPALSFASYAKQQHAAAQGGDTEWWVSQFASIPAALNLPADRPRPSVRSFRGGTRKYRLDIVQVEALKKAGAAHGCTLFTTLLAVFSILLGRLAEQEDVVVAVPVAGQSQLEDKTLVGHCANLLPIRAIWTGDLPFDRFLGSLRQTVLDAYDRQDCTLGTLVRALGVARDTARLPLTDVQFNLERLGDGVSVAGLEASGQANPKAFVNFDLFLNAVESSHGLTFECDYNVDLFDAETVDRWLGHLSVLLTAIASDPAVPVARLPLLSAADRDYLLKQDGTAMPVPDVRVHRLIEAQAARLPEAPAVRQGDLVMSYQALDRRANQIAHVLAAHASPGSRVAIMMDRTADMLAVLLATWKAGLAYVPLDPSHPVARLRHVLADADAALLVTDGIGPVLDAMVLNLADHAATITRAPSTPPPIDDTSDATAYVIYTSGSTGLPKGVAVGHRALANLLLSMGREPGIHQDDVWLAVTTVSFDIAGLELFGPLLAGAQVALASREDVADGHRLLERLASTGATIMQATPATWRLLLEAGFKPRGLKMLCGGEPLPRALADQLYSDGGELWNMYGPTETTIWSALERVDAGPITVGHPIANTSLHVLDAADHLQPIGVPGQLHIGGLGLAEGYRNRPELTAARFIADPFKPEGRLYRTGDFAKRLPDGRIQVLGRLDGQIKLRGYRIETGEIEHVLTTQCGLTAAVVGLHGTSEAELRLVAWVVPASGAQIDDRALRRELRCHLPDYMVPSVFTAIERLPLTPNGKIDRQRLPEIGKAAPIIIEPAQTELERQIIEIWSELLRHPIGRNDDVILVGADSIQIFQMTARLRAAGLTIQAKDLLEHRTPARLATAISDPRTEQSPARPRLAEFRRDRRVMIAGE